MEEILHSFLLELSCPYETEVYSLVVATGARAGPVETSVRHVGGRSPVIIILEHTLSVRKYTLFRWFTFV